MEGAHPRNTVQFVRQAATVPAVATMITEVYDALKDAGASDEKARAAASVLANYDDRFNALERQIDRRFNEVDSRFVAFERQIDSRFVAIERSLAIQQLQTRLMIGAMLAIGLPAIWLLGRVAAKVGALSA